MNPPTEIRVTYVLVLGCFLLLFFSLQARADQSKENEVIDVSSIQHELTFLHDGKGHYIAARAKSEGDRVLYYGNGTTFYQQRIFGGGSDTTGANPQFSWFYWSPRTVKGHGSLQLREKKWAVQCDKRKTTMTELSLAKADQLRAKAIFQKPLWKRAAHALARDDRGTYYYVDRLRKDLGGKDYRVYIGKLGNLKTRRMTNIVSDTRGQIFVTRSGKLRLVLDEQEALWIRKGKNRKLRMVPVKQNQRMIYSDLGVYEQAVGTPCDHL